MFIVFFHFKRLRNEGQTAVLYLYRFCFFRTINLNRVVFARSRSTPPFHHHYMTMKWHYIEPIENRKEKYYHRRVFTRIETVDTENSMLKLKAMRGGELWVIFWRDDSSLYSITRLKIRYIWIFLIFRPKSYIGYVT